MEAREGYKKTELGWIPEEWEVQNIGSICDVKGGKRLPKGDSLVDEDTGYPYIRVADMFMGGVKTNALKFVPVETVSKIKNYIINKEDLFISVAGTLGIVGKIPAVLDGANLTENADKLTNITIDRHFLFFVLSSDIIQGVIQKEATINALPKLAIQKIKTFLFPLPPLPEQQKIAEILTTVDDKISSIEDRIQQTEQLKKGLMEKLLTEGIGHTEFKDTEIGRIPASWDVGSLADCCNHIQDGTHFSPKSKNGPFKYITSKNIKNDKIDLTNVSYISADDHNSIFSRCPVEFGDVLLTKDGANTGNLALNTLREPFSLLSSVAFIRSNPNKATNPFIFQYLLSPFGQQTIKSAIAGQAITRITLSKIKAFQVPLPKIIEQKQIATILSTVDDKLGILQSKKFSYETLKKGLMEQLLTGKIHVKV